jgi:hypothetical protein
MARDMKLVTRRLRQVVIGILAVLSLSITSVAACACSHHHEKPKEQSSCHGTGQKPHKPAADAPQANFLNESCVCVRSAVKELAKAEVFKLKKHQTAFAASVDVQPLRFSSLLLPDSVAEASAFHSGVSLAAASSRGPPVS